MKYFFVRDEIEKILCDMTKTKIDKPHFKYERLKTFGIDCSNIGELIIKIENHFGIKLDLTDVNIKKIKTVDKLVLLVNESIYRKAPWEY